MSKNTFILKAAPEARRKTSQISMGNHDVLYRREFQTYIESGGEERGQVKEKGEGTGGDRKGWGGKYKGQQEYAKDGRL